MIYKDKKALIESYITPGMKVLDVGFWGQGVSVENPHWPHRLLFDRGCDLYGLDLEYDEKRLLVSADRYRKQSAEEFSFDVRFDLIFAGDLIEHLSNPGLFLSCAKKHLTPGGKLIMTTPNCFNIFNISEKFSKGEPTVNPDHTCYFNPKTLKQLLEKNGWTLDRTDYLYSLGKLHTESFKKRFLNCIYWVLSRFTERYSETMVVIAHPHASPAHT